MKTPTYLLVCLSVCGAMGCRSAPTFASVYLPNGQRGAVITCSYRSECFNNATRACGGGAYTVLEGEDITPHVPDNDRPVSGNLIPTNDFNPITRGTQYVIGCIENEHHGDGT